MVDELTILISKWHKDRKITINGNSLTQTVKLLEEAGELASGVTNKDLPEIMDALGDMYVVMVAIAELEGVPIGACIEKAYLDIKDRKGYLNEAGIFIKDVSV